MPKTPHLGIEITANTSTKFGYWWRKINSEDADSFANLVDEFAGSTDNRLNELYDETDDIYENVYTPIVESGTPGQFLSKTDNGLEWKTVSSPSGGGSVIDVTLDSENPNVTMVQNEFYNIQVNSDDEHIISFSSIGSSPTDYIEHKGQIHFNSSANVTFADNSIEWLGGLPTFKVGDVVEFSVVLGIGIAVSTNRKIESVFLHQIYVFVQESPIGIINTFPEIGYMYLLSGASIVGKKPEEFTAELLKLIKTNTTGVTEHVVGDGGELDNVPITMNNGVLANDELGTIIDINNMPTGWYGVTVEDYQLDLNGNFVMSYKFLTDQYESATDRFLTIPNHSYLQRWIVNFGGAEHTIMIDSPISIVGMTDGSTELRNYIYGSEWNGNVDFPSNDIGAVSILRENDAVWLRHSSGSVDLSTVDYINIQEIDSNANIVASVTYENGIEE